MQDKIQKQLLDAFFVVLRPIAKILLRYGIGFREFAEVAKTAFVDVATSDFGIRGRPTNISRVAVMTGLTRKEIKRLRDGLETGYESLSVKSTPLAAVIHRWHSDSEYLDDSGRPAFLPFKGKRRSFESLVKKYGGDIPPGAMRAELRRIDAIEEDDNGSLRAIRRTIRPKADHDNLTTSLMHSAYALLANIENNTNPEIRESWGQMLAYTADIREADTQKLRRISEDRLGEVAESFDDLFMAYESLTDAEKELSKVDTCPVAVGVFYFEERDSNFRSLWES